MAIWGEIAAEPTLDGKITSAISCARYVQIPSHERSLVGNVLARSVIVPPPPRPPSSILVGLRLAGEHVSLFRSVFHFHRFGFAVTAFIAFTFHCVATYYFGIISSSRTCQPDDAMTSAAPGGAARSAAYAAASFLLGAWAFYEVNSISGPAFEPILAACTSPDYSSIEDFASKTGYHAYEPKLGLGAFNVLVCLITQFLLELRETPPAGLLVWGGVVVVSMPMALMNTLAAGRRGGRGPVRYPTIFGLLFQLFGISVIYPMLWTPSYVCSRSKLGVPATKARILFGTIFALPVSLLTFAVFYAPTDGYLWTCSAGILGGPLLAMGGIVLWWDKSHSLEAGPRDVEKSNLLVQRCYDVIGIASFAFWSYLVSVAYQTYGFAFDRLWRDIWAEAGPSVAFMTIDTGVLYLGILVLLAYESEKKALKALALTPLLGPGAACSVAFKELEGEAAAALIAESSSEKKAQ
ncbi:hypothetical protein ACHAWF_011530 [Thalassiosira exigua]